MSEQESSSRTYDVLEAAKRAGLKRWNLETVTQLLGINSLHHNAEQNRLNIQAENRAVRKKLWGSKEQESDEMPGNIYAGDVTTPTPVVINQQPQSSGLGQILGLVAGSAIGIPAAGMLLGPLLESILSPEVPKGPSGPITQVVQSEEQLDVRLLTLDELKE